MNREKTFKACKCGCRRFIGHRMYRFDVIVDGDGYWQEDLECYDAETPYGPFECAECGKEYAELSDIPQNTEVIEYDGFVTIILERLKKDFPDANPVRWTPLRDDGTGYDDDIVMDGDYANPIHLEDYYIDLVEGKSLDAVYQSLVASIWYILD